MCRPRAAGGAQPALSIRVRSLAGLRCLLRLRMPYMVAVVEAASVITRAHVDRSTACYAAKLQASTAA